MIWLFHRCGEYLSCEVRTCLENTGFELLISRPGKVQLEWYPDEQEVERRWADVDRELRRDGWASSPPVPNKPGGRFTGTHR